MSNQCMIVTQRSAVRHGLTRAIDVAYDHVPHAIHGLGVMRNVTQAIEGCGDHPIVVFHSLNFAATFTLNFRR